MATSLKTLRHHSVDPCILSLARKGCARYHVDDCGTRLLEETGPLLRGPRTGKDHGDSCCCNRLHVPLNIRVKQRHIDCKRPIQCRF